MLLSTKRYTQGKYFHLYMMTDSKLAFTTHWKVFVLILDRNTMQFLQLQKETARIYKFFRRRIDNETQIFIMSMYYSCSILTS